MCYLRGWSQTPAASTRDARLLTLLMREEVLAPSKAVLRHKDADASMVRAAVAVAVAVPVAVPCAVPLWVRSMA